MTQSNTVRSVSTGWTETVQKGYQQRWRIWVVAVLAHTVGMFHRTAMAPVADRIMADFGVTATAFGSLGAAYYYTYGAMQIPVGTLIDNIGPRRIITFGLLLATIGTIVMGTAPSFGLVYLGRVLVSLGVSGVWLSVIKVITVWFRPRELATMTGASGFGINLGQMAATTPFALLVGWVGWRMSFVSIGSVTLVIAIFVWLIVRDSPAKVGLPPITELDSYAAASADTPGEPRISLAQKLKKVFGTRNLWSMFMLGFGTYGAFATLFQSWIVVYLMQTYGVSRDFAAGFALTATIGLMLSMLMSGFLSDRVFRRRRLPAVLFASLTLISFIILAMWNGGKPPFGALYLICFFMGVGNGSLAVQFAYVNEVVPYPLRGVAAGVVNTNGFVGSILAQPLFGYILDLGWRGEMIGNARVYPLQAFQNGFFLCLALAAVGFLGALLLKETHCRDTTAS